MVYRYITAYRVWPTEGFEEGPVCENDCECLVYGNYFHVSFGKQDMLQRAIEKIKDIEGLCIDEKPSTVYGQLIKSSNLSTLKELKYFDQEVPWRFLSPWIKGSKREVYRSCCPYALYDDVIEINPVRVPYLIQNAGITKSFRYWLYLQKHNPNVPDILNKLIKPPSRNGLTKQRKLWDIVLHELGHINCIYTDKKLQHGNYAIEHFIPHAFVSHDLMWNLIPACKSFNSSKSDKLANRSIF